tara:strand:- start:356 stop:880 length:525 start_codon:yes stop_codon:yes gene_type:complete
MSGNVSIIRVEAYEGELLLDSAEEPSEYALEQIAALKPILLDAGRCLSGPSVLVFSDGDLRLHGHDEMAVREWLTRIGETDQDEIYEALYRCVTDPDALTYCLDQAAQMPEPDYSATCGTCSHFQRIDHIHLGHCSKGEPEAPAGLWDTTWRWCMKYEQHLAEGTATKMEGQQR